MALELTAQDIVDHSPSKTSETQKQAISIDVNRDVKHLETLDMLNHFDIYSIQIQSEKAFGNFIAHIHMYMEIS